MGDSDAILSALRKEAHERDPSQHPRWEALAKGELSADEERALAEEAEASPAIRELFEAYRPLGPEAEDRYTARLLAAAKPPRAPDKPKPVRRPTWRSSVIGLALAAALAAVLFIPRPSALPEYSIAIAGGEQVVRGEPQAAHGTPIIGPGSRLSIVLRPATKLEGAIEARAFLVRDGSARVWSPPIEISSAGAVRIEGTREQLFHGVPAGRWEIVVALSKPGDAPNADDLRPKAGRRLIRTEVDLRDTLAE